MKVLLKLANFKIFLIFGKYNSKPLTCIFNFARRQIQKKLCWPFKNSHFFGKFEKKLSIMRFLGIKMVKNTIFGLVSRINHYPRCKTYTLVNSQKNFFWSWATSLRTIASQNVYIKYIYYVFSEVAKTSKWSCPTSIFFFIFSNFCVCSLTYISKITRG